jgi:hypothetical protein
MSEPLRHDPSSSPETAEDRESRIEELLLAGLDRYFSGEYDQAIDVWTRVLFLDRGHARARAYIERARSALAERQREGEELLHTGVAAFNRGDAGAARRLLTSAVERGGPADEALLVLERLDRLAGPSTPSEPEDRPVARRERPVREADLARRRSPMPLLLAVVLGLLAGALGAVQWWDRVAPFLQDRAGQDLGVVRVPDAPLPVLGASEVALGRADALFKRGRHQDAMRALEVIRPGDPLNPQADALRTQIQNALLSAAGFAPKAGR